MCVCVCVNECHVARQLHKICNMLKVSRGKTTKRDKSTEKDMERVGRGKMRSFG